MDESWGWSLSHGADEIKTKSRVRPSSQPTRTIWQAGRQAGRQPGWQGKEMRAPHSLTVNRTRRRCSLFQHTYIGVGRYVSIRT